MESPIEEIKKERESQTQLGYDSAHDVTHDGWELLSPAIHLLCRVYGIECEAVNPPAFDVKCMKDGGCGYLADRKKLVVAAALIVAEIERLDRLHYS
jgi:hypothetical protein